MGRGLPPSSTFVRFFVRESDKSTRWIKEEVHIRKDGRQSFNRDKGSYTLSRTYDRFLATSHHCRGKKRKKNWTNFWWRSLLETETSKGKNVGCVEVIVFYYDFMHSATVRIRILFLMVKYVQYAYGTKMVIRVQKWLYNTLKYVRLSLSFINMFNK